MELLKEEENYLKLLKKNLNLEENYESNNLNEFNLSINNIRFGNNDINNPEENKEIFISDMEDSFLPRNSIELGITKIINEEGNNIENLKYIKNYNINSAIKMNSYSKMKQINNNENKFQENSNSPSKIKNSFSFGNKIYNSFTKKNKGEVKNFTKN